MKNKKTLIICVSAVSLAVLMLVFGIIFTFSDKISAYFSGFIFTEEFDDKKPFSVYNFEQLSDKEKQAYVCIFEKIESHPKYIKIPKLTKEEFNNVYFAVKNDNPDMLCFSDTCNMIAFWSAAFVELNYAFDTSECNNMKSELISEINSIVKNMPILTDNFEKELYIHDYIVLNCSYQETANSSNAYGCLIEKKAVCSGYSRAVMLLLNSVGIKSVLIGGTAVSSAQGEISHMWNIVWLGGEPYHLDVTWDDPGTDENISHMYFNLSDNDIGSDHIDYNFNYPCNSEKYNYFRYKGLYFDAYGKKQLEIIQHSLLNNIENGVNYIEIMFFSKESFELSEKSIVNGISPQSDMYKIISFISTHAGDKVDVSHVNVSSDINKKYIRLMFDWN